MSQNTVSQVILASALLFNIFVRGDTVIFITDSSKNCHLSTGYTQCTTLSQLAGHGSLIRSENNLTVVFSPGTHTLNVSNFSMAGISHVSMKSSSEAGNTHINCYGTARFKFKFNTFVHVRGLTFTGCLENEVTAVEKFVMEDCQLTGDRGRSGHALTVFNSSVHIARSMCTSFYDYDCQGGAIYCSMSSVFISVCTFADNRALSGGAVYAENHSNVTLVDSTFFNNTGCYNDINCPSSVNESTAVTSDCFSSLKYNQYLQLEGLQTIGTVLSAFESSLSIQSCTFKNNTATHGGVILCHNGTKVCISNSNFSDNRATAGYGGVVYQAECDVKINRSNFANNSGKLGGVLYHDSITMMDNLILEDSYFKENSAKRGGVAFISRCNINILRCQFEFNEAMEEGGALFLTTKTNITISDTNFTNNKAENLGGALRAMNDAKVYLSLFVSFKRNSAHYGAAVHCYSCDQFTVTTNASAQFIRNNATVGIILSINSDVNFYGETRFAENYGSLYVHGSQAYVSKRVTFLGGQTLSKMEGGCITLLLSILVINGTEIEMNSSSAQNGGGLLALSSNINVISKSTVSILDNNASDTGGGMYLYQSKLYIEGIVDVQNNCAQKYGGGIHADSSVIVLHVQNHQVRLLLDSNTAGKGGGGVYLAASAHIYITQLDSMNRSKAQPVQLFRNSADCGGAMYVDDSTNKGTCLSGGNRTQTILTDIWQSQCFFQIIRIDLSVSTFSDAFWFSENTALVAGPLLYGGLLDRCTMAVLGRKDHVRFIQIPHSVTSIYNITSSDPIRVCPCNKNGSEVRCDQLKIHINVTKGEWFSLNVSAVDQMNRSTNATFYSDLRHDLTNFSSLEPGKIKPFPGGTCKRLFFTINSPHSHQELILYADGPCNRLGVSKLRVAIDFEPCKCPPGFEESHAPDTCECVCHKKLLTLPFIRKSDCNSSTLTLTRYKNYWISIVNETYEQCPLDYCVPPKPLIDIDLSTLNGTDKQCNFKRTGKLCGRCREGLSLSLGSSRCLRCPNYWPAIFLLITICAGLAGFLLVALLLVLNLTVASGTLNGLIFYANIIGTNQGLYLPFQRTNFHTIFISWLNLDIGFDVCYIKDMDTYLKTWLHLLFPVYLMSLVIVVMIGSKYSVRFSRLISLKNPVATLATLILLSYTKLLNSIIMALSFADISHIPESDDRPFLERVWYYDASVQYFKGRHIPLFIAAILLLLLGLVYTFLLLFWQFIVRLPDRAVFRWARNTKLSSFIDAYHCPYTARNRYWTGLLLLARVILHLTSISGKQGVDLLAVSLIVGGILLFQGYSGIRTYKKLTLNTFELTSYFNILAFTCAKFYIELTEATDHVTIAYLSVSAEFVLFLCAISYHMTVEFNIPHRLRRCKIYRLNTRILKELRVPFLDPNYLNTDAVTRSEVKIDDRNGAKNVEMTSLESMSERADTSILFSASGDRFDH